MAEVKISDFQFYLSKGNITATPTFVLVNKGITEMSESPNLQSEETHYIADENTTSIDKGYAASFAVTGALFTSEGTIDPAGKELHDIGYMRKKGEDAERLLVSIDMSKKTAAQTEFPARQFKVFVVTDSFTGTAGASKGFSVTLKVQGDMEVGTFDIEDLTFTPQP